MTELGIVAFLTRCLDEAQARAELAQQVIGGQWDGWEVVAQQLHACCDTVPGIGRAGQLLQHEADPSRVLADIAAKRKLLAIWQRAEAATDSPGFHQLADEILEQLVAPYGKRAVWTPKGASGPAGWHLEDAE